MLLQILERVPTSAYHLHGTLRCVADYIGCFHRGGRVVDEKSNKWYESWDNRVYFYNQYPTYANGAAYVLSHRAVHYIA